MVLILVVAILYFGFKPGDSFLMALTPLAFLARMPYAVPMLVGLGGGVASVIPGELRQFFYIICSCM